MEVMSIGGTVFYNEPIIFYSNLYLVAGFKARFFQPYAAYIQPGYLLNVVLQGPVFAMQLHLPDVSFCHVDKN